MKKFKKKGFTLIELIAVLVIMAIIALIVTPLVMNIIRKARVSADKRSIDAYGRSIELAIAGYLLDTGKFQTEVSQLTIEYSGNKVECETTQINTDSSVYLAGCTVAGRSTGDYTYGSDKSPTYTAYTVGDQVTYNNINYYVIKNSDASEASVTLLKATPITSSEISLYLSSTEVANKVDTTGTYATMAYYSRDNCVSAGDQTGCSTDYSLSDIKQVVDVWKANYASGANSARLLTYEEASEYAEAKQICTGSCYEEFSLKYDWMYNNNYWYCLGTPYTDSSSSVWSVNDRGALGSGGVSNHGGGVVRPVIVLSKSEL